METKYKNKRNRKFKEEDKDQGKKKYVKKGP
jgi:hypothetical protein